MTVYVDDLQDWTQLAPARGVRWTHWAHLTADSRQELHAIAARLGLQRSWFQEHPRCWHDDVSAAKRAQALRLGAIAVTARELAALPTGRSGTATPADTIGGRSVGQHCGIRAAALTAVASSPAVVTASGILQARCGHPTRPAANAATCIAWRLSRRRWRPCWACGTELPVSVQAGTQDNKHEQGDAP